MKRMARFVARISGLGFTHKDGASAVRSKARPPVHPGSARSSAYSARHRPLRSSSFAFAILGSVVVLLAFGTQKAAALEPAAITIDPPTSVSYTSAQVSGTIDPKDEDTYFYFQYSADPSQGWNIGAFQGPLAAGSGVHNVADDLTGLAAGTEYQVRLTAFRYSTFQEEYSAEPNPVFTTEGVDTPGVSIESATGITDDGAQFSGTINPTYSGTSPAELNDVDWHFECTPECPNAGGGTISADAVDHVVTGTATGLDPNLDYEVRLIAENAGPPKTASTTFKTATAPPFVQTSPASAVTDSSAWLGGKINPQNSATTYYVEYSTDPTVTESAHLPASDDAPVDPGNSLVGIAHRRPDCFRPLLITSGSSALEPAPRWVRFGRSRPSLKHYQLDLDFLKAGSTRRCPQPTREVPTSIEVDSVSFSKPWQQLLPMASLLRTPPSVDTGLETADQSRRSTSLAEIRTVRGRPKALSLETTSAPTF